MSYVPVDFVLRDQEGTLLQDAYVVVFSEDLLVRHQEGLTGADGKISALLPSGFTYEIRINHPSASMKVVQIEVEGPDQETHELEVRRRLPEDATDPRYCAIYEQFAAVGTVAQGVVRARLTEQLVVDAYSATLNAPIPGELRNGHYRQLFPRGARVAFMLPGSDSIIEATIPDRASARLTDVLFPYLYRVYLDPEVTDLVVGDPVETSFYVELSDGRIVRPGDSPSLQLTYDRSKLEVVTGATTTTFKALEAGSLSFSVLLEESVGVFPDATRLRRSVEAIDGLRTFTAT